MFFAGLHRRQRIEVRRIGVVPAEIALVYRLHAMAQVAVVTARVPLARDAPRQLQLLGDLRGGEPVADQPHGLVVHIFVEVTPLLEVIAPASLAPYPPMVLAVV